MLGLLYALITVLAWGTWLAPSQNVPLRNQQIKMFYVAATNLLIATVISLAQGWGQLNLNVMWLPFLGGLIWSASGLCAFTATSKLGMARAFGIWAPLNIIVSLICGRMLFQEFANASGNVIAVLLTAVGVIIAGVLLIIAAQGSGGAARDRKSMLKGYAGAVGAGFLWGVYFIPIKMSGLSLWLVALPMAMGMFAGSAALVLADGKLARLDKSGDYGRVCATGVLWATGNYGMLLLVDAVGAGKGYTISQLSVVVNAIIGIYLLKDPRPGTRAARMTLAGCVLATVGGILMGLIK
jgi:glucose uptake protein